MWSQQYEALPISKYVAGLNQLKMREPDLMKAD